MKYTITQLILLGMIMGFASFGYSDEENGKQPKPSMQTSQKANPETNPPIPLEDVYRRGIAGRLGVRMGTLVEVKGHVIENQSKAKADSDIPFFLRIESVNGKPLATPQEFEFKKANQWVKVQVPKIGSRFHYHGYETGYYWGILY